jgi:hypothetical protein
MPIILIAFGLILIDVGIRDKEKEFFALLKEILLGGKNQTSYLKWAIAIFIIGLLGYIQEFRDLDIAFLILVFIVMLDSNNFLSQFINDFKNLT